MEIDVLDHGGGGDDEYARDRRDGRRERADDRKAEQCRRHHRRHQMRDHTIDAAELLCRHHEHPAPEHADKVHRDIHKGNHDRPDDHRAVHIGAAPIADRAHHRLRQRDRQRPHEQPLRDIERHGHMPRRRRRQHLRTLRAQRLHDRGEPAARIEHIVKEQYDPRHHHQRTAGICQCNSTESADRCIDNNYHAEEYEPQLIAVSRDRRKELRPADELRHHRGGKEHDDRKRRQRRERIRTIAVTDDVDDRHRVNAAGETRHLFPENAEHQENRHRLNDRHVDPTEADLVRHPGAADERTHGAVRRHHRHREHERPERLPADEVPGEKAARALMAAHIDPEREHKGHKTEERQEHIERIHRSAPSPRVSNGISSDARAR